MVPAELSTLPYWILSKKGYLFNCYFCPSEHFKTFFLQDQHISCYMSILSFLVAVVIRIFNYFLICLYDIFNFNFLASSNFSGNSLVFQVYVFIQVVILPPFHYLSFVMWPLLELLLLTCPGSGKLMIMVANAFSFFFDSNGNASV